jgi:hypothetical protein
MYQFQTLIQTHRITVLGKIFFSVTLSAPLSNLTREILVRMYDLQEREKPRTVGMLHHRLQTPIVEEYSDDPISTKSAPHARLSSQTLNKSEAKER